MDAAPSPAHNSKATLAVDTLAIHGPYRRNNLACCSHYQVHNPLWLINSATRNVTQGATKTRKAWRLNLHAFPK